MDLHEAYRILEVAAGASEEVVRDARKTLSKVWHPDRYMNDAELRVKAEVKLREINEAFEQIRGAGFPASVGPAAKAATAASAPSAASAASAASVVATSAPAPAPPRADPSIEFVPTRRVRWPVVLGLFVAIGVGAYFAILQLGKGDPQPTARVSDPTPTPTPPPTPVPAPIPIAPIPVAPPAPIPVAPIPIAPSPLVDLPPPPPPSTGSTFTLGANQSQVVALQGDPNGTESSSSIDSETVDGRSVTIAISRSKLTYGHSEIDLVDDKVVGWWDNDVRLHVRLVPHDPAVVAAARARGTLATGGTTDNLLGVLGMPTRVTARRWSYGTSAIDLDDAGHIVGATRGDVDLHFTR